MKTITKTINLHTFEELSEKAKAIKYVTETFNLSSNTIKDLKEQLLDNCVEDFYIHIYLESAEDLEQEFEYLYYDDLDDDVIRKMSLEDKQARLLKDYKLFPIEHHSFMAVPKCFLKEEYR